MKSVARFSLDRALAGAFARLSPGRVLDVGAKSSPYRSKVPHTNWMTLDVDPSRGADLVGDIHDVQWRSGDFDTVIATEVLEHCHTPHRAVNEIRRLLKPDGVCILSTRFIYPYHPDPRDYYRFTEDGLRHLFREFADVEVIRLGNRLHSLWILATGVRFIKRILGVLNPIVALIDWPGRTDSCSPGSLVFARK